MLRNMLRCRFVRAQADPEERLDFDLNQQQPFHTRTIGRLRLGADG